MEQKILNRILMKAIEFDRGDAKRIQHLTKVFEYSRIMGIEENLSENELDILETAAIMHDIGIHPAEEKFGRNDGKLQEQLGPDTARKLLEEFNLPEENMERICYLIGHHHTYKNIDGTDYQILVEADFLVNLYEDNESIDSVRNVYERIFRTESGKKLCRDMFGL